MSNAYGIRAERQNCGGFAVSGTPVALATLWLPPSHRRQNRRGRRSGNLIVIHVRRSFSPWTVIKEREVSQLCWHGGRELTPILIKIWCTCTLSVFGLISILSAITLLLSPSARYLRTSCSLLVSWYLT